MDQTINKCERLSLLALNTFSGVNPKLAVMVCNSCVYDRRKRVAKTETALLPVSLVNLVECLAPTMTIPAMVHM